MTATVLAVLAASLAAGVVLSLRAESRRIDNHIAKFLREEHLDD